MSKHLLDDLKIYCYKNRLGYEAVAYLKNSKINFANNLYSNALATGSGLTIRKAKQVVISESIERIAMDSIKDESEIKRYKFDIVPNSTGMAAHPWAFRARENAKYEAIERWTLHHWWHDKISMERASGDFGHVMLLKKELRKNGTVVVLICDYRTESGFFYGFAAHKSFIKAYKKALVELERNYRVLKNYYQNEQIIKDYSEKRVIYFSTTLGFQEFAKKVKKNSSIVDSLKPELILDCEIPGPWTKWRRVWRVLFENQVPLDFQNLNVFMF